MGVADFQDSSSSMAPYQVAAAIRSALVRGEYAPGQRLVESELCARYGVGRAMAREALRLLDGDGLVEVQPHRAARVRTLTVSQAIQVAEVREAVEGLLARQAALHATPDDVAELREIARLMQVAVDAFDPLGYSALNERLHERIAEIADHEAAMAISNRLRLQLVRFNMRLSLQPGRPLATLRDHERVIDAIAVGDGAAAEAAMREHLAEVATTLRALDLPSTAGL